MEKLINWIRDSLWKIWEGILHNIVTIIFVFFVSGGYLVVINKVQHVQKWVRQLPTDWILTPLVFLLVIVAILLRVNHKQRIKLSDFERQIPSDEKNAKFITHLGVWWKIHFDAEYIEDFPYCPCCEPKKKLLQTEWFPDEKYKCPITNTEIKLFDEIPRKKSDILESLYNAYFRGFSVQTETQIHKELNRYRELNPSADKRALLNHLFTIYPFNNIPHKEQKLIIDRFTEVYQALSFIERNYDTYKKYFKRKKRRINIGL